MRHEGLMALAVMAGFPGAAFAQNAADLAAQQRMFDAQRRLDSYETNQRLDQIERQTETLDMRLRTEQNLRAIEAQRSLIPPPQNPPLVSVAPPATPADIAAAERRREAALQASETRLQSLAKEMSR